MSKNDKICIVFVTNKLYIEKFIKTCKLLITNGEYKGDICLIYGNDLKDIINDYLFIKENKIITKYFEDLIFPEKFYETKKNKKITRGGTKLFQYHKLHLFNVYFKKWDYIFYMDSTMRIYRDVEPLIECKTPNKLVAHSDAYPDHKWKLKSQFIKNVEKYNTNCDYFQTTMMIYDTNIINETTFNDLYNLSIEYDFASNNDQSILALYFICEKNIWEKLPIKKGELYLYDSIPRNRDYDYVMLSHWIIHFGYKIPPFTPTSELIRDIDHNNFTYQKVQKRGKHNWYRVFNKDEGYFWYCKNTGESSWN